MARFDRVGSYVFALFIIVSLLASSALGQAGASAAAQRPAANPGDSTVLPPGASQDWWSSVQEQIGQSEYHISWQEGTGLPDLAGAFQAPNRAQNLRTYFTESGIQVVPRADSTAAWNLGLTLTGYSYEGDSRPVTAAEMSVQENRADYDRGDVTEWYVNTESGLEQGFTLNAPPSGSTGQGSALVLQLSLSGDLTPSLVEAEQAVDFTTPGGVRVLRYADLEVVDAEGEVLDANLGVSGDGLSITIDAASAAFPITVDPLLDDPGWTAESNVESAEFGYSVATAGDVNCDGYSDVIVGAPYYTNDLTEEGRAYLYLGSASGLSATATWSPEGNSESARFGCSVATAGDVNGDGYSDVIVGASNYDNGDPGEGMAFVYHGSSVGLSSTPAWSAEGNDPNNSFLGCSVGTAGDVNGDGYSDVIIGAYGYNVTGAADAGMVLVYHGSPSGLVNTGGTPADPGDANWRAEGNEAVGRLGYSVGTAGDVNRDGFADVIVGAENQGSGGGAFVWYGSSNGVNNDVDGTPSDAYCWTALSDQADSKLGCSVGTAGDVNGDGYADVIVGANQYSTDGAADPIEEGIALVWYGSSGTDPLGADGTPTNADRLLKLDSAQGAEFGTSVGTAGDVDGDGYADVIVGAPAWANGQGLEGGIAVYRGSSVGLDATGAWAQESNLETASLGCSVATAGDVNGDGYSDVIAGAYGYANGQSYEGRAYVYCGYADGLMATALWGAQGDQAGGDAGFSVGTAGDVNGDGYADVIVGAVLYDGGLLDEGRVWVFHGSATVLSVAAARTLECDASSAQFGYSVGTAGDVNGDGYDDVIIGANEYESGVDQTNEGAAYIYYGSAGGLEATYGWRIEGNQLGAEMGCSVGTAGDVNGDGYADFIVGAQHYQAALAEEGRAYVFHGSAAGPATDPSWTVDGGQAHASFGCSVSTAGDVNRDGFSDVIVGAYGFTNVEAGEGKAFVYHGAASGLSTTPAWSKESNQGGAQFGRAVSTAGDVNGDGFADVIVGAWHFTSPESMEGAAFVYHGSAGGLSTTQSWSAQSNLENVILGYSVDGAGDVNGDGYADVIIGAPYYGSAGQAEEGAAVLWYGSSAGLGDNGTPGNADWGVEGNQEGAYFGHSVASAGDVNGDGYADVIIGANSWDVNDGSPTEIENAGGAVLYYGGGRCGVSLNPQQERSDSTPVAHLGRSDRTDAFRLTVDVRTPFGRGKAQLQCEVKPLGTAFNGSGLRESSSWTTSGSEISYLVDGLSGNTNYHWRVRLHYNPATTPFQQYSRWVTMPWNGWQEADFRTAAPPAVTTNDADKVTTTSARLNATLTSRGSAASVIVSFEYGTKSGGPYAAVAAGNMTITGTFSASIGSLTAGTRYYFRAKAEGISTVYGEEKSFTAGTTPPTVTTIDAGNITATSATLRGNLAVLGTATSVAVSFEYATTSGGPYMAVTAGDKDAPGDFSADISGLAPNTHYYFRAVAAGAGTDYGNEKSFTTSTAPPAVTTNDATNVTASSATLNGNLDSPGSAASVTVSFEYGTTSGGPYTAVAAGALTAPGAFSADISGLASGILYYFRAVATGDGTSQGLEKSFTAGTTPPAVATGDATYVTNVYARLNGSLTSLGGAGSVAVSFEYATASGGPYTGVEAGTMAATGDFSFNLSGLTPGTPYYFRAKAAGAGFAYGEEKTFTTGTTADETAPSTPQVTDNGESTTTTTEIYASWSSGDNESGVVEYLYAVATTAGGNDVVDWTSAGTATEKTITGLSLTPGQTYYVSVKAVNGQGLTSEVGSSDGIVTGNADTGKGGGTPFWVWILVALGAAGLGGTIFFPLWRRQKKAKPVQE